MFDITQFRHAEDNANDYFPAFKRLVDEVNTAGGGDVLFPPGVYYMDVPTQAAPESPAKTAAAFVQCRNLRISGYGAKIDLRGDFRRTKDNDQFPRIGLHFYDCSHFVVEGLEIDGNVDQLTRDANVDYEPGSDGIFTVSCEHYTFRDLFIHHNARDGLNLGGGMPTSNGYTYDEHALLVNVRSHHNARQGISITGMQGFTAVRCDFAYTGRTGTYGVHAPGAGVDIEPEGPNVVTQDILFLGCRFHDNLGGNIGAGYPDRSSRITFRDCLVSYPESRGWEGNEHGVILYSHDGLMENCYLDLGTRNVYLSHFGPSPDARNTLRNCTIRSNRNAIASLYAAEALVQGCRIICTATTPTSEFPWSWNPKLRFVDNYVFRPKESFTRQAGVAMRASYLTGAEYRDNRWDTDLTTTTGEYFGSEYVSPVIRDERYLTPQYRYYWSDVTPSTAGVPFSIYNASGAADNVPDAPALTAPASISSTYTASELTALRNDVETLRATIKALLDARREVFEQV